MLDIKSGSLVFVQAKVGIPGDAKGDRLQYFFPGKNLDDEHAAQHLPEDERVATFRLQRENTFQGTAERNDGVAGFFRSLRGRRETNENVQRTVGQEREIFGRSNGLRRIDGVDFRFENLFDKTFLPFRKFGQFDAFESRGGQCRFELFVKTRILFGTPLMRVMADSLQLFGRSEAGRVLRVDSSFGEHLQPPDTNHKELVQIRRCYGQELQSLEQGDAVVLRLAQNTLIEFDPAQVHD